MLWSREAEFVMRLVEVLDAVVLQSMALLAQILTHPMDVAHGCGLQRDAVSHLSRAERVWLLVQDGVVAGPASLLSIELAGRLRQPLVGGWMVAACRLADEVRRWMDIGRVGRPIVKERAGVVSVAQAR